MSAYYKMLFSQAVELTGDTVPDAVAYTATEVAISLARF